MARGARDLVAAAAARHRGRRHPRGDQGRPRGAHPADRRRMSRRRDRAGARPGLLGGPPAIPSRCRRAGWRARRRGRPRGAAAIDAATVRYLAHAYGSPVLLCTRRPRRTPCCTRCPPCHASCGRRACRPSGRPAPLPAYLPSTDCAISSMSLGQPDPHTRHFRSYRSLQRSIQIEGTATERHRVRPERGGVLAARNHPRCRWTGRPSSNTRTVVHIALAQNHRPRWLRTRGGAVSAPEATGLWPTVRMDSSHSRLTRLCGRCAWTSANPAPRSPDPRSQADAVAVEPPFSNSRVSLG